MGNSHPRRARRPGVEENTKPTGLYGSCAWDDNAVHRLVDQGKIAPRVKGDEDGTDKEECPICFLYYSTFNRSTCCKQTICTECYLQVHPPNGPTSCPFCNAQPLVVTYATPRAPESRKNIQKTVLSDTECVTNSPQISRKEQVSKMSVTDSAVASPTIFATADDRRQLEAEMKRARSSSLGTDMDMYSPSPVSQTTNRRGGGRSSSVRRPERTGNRSIEGLFHELDALSDLRQFEEMMIMEAIRQSIADNNPAPAPVSTPAAAHAAASAQATPIMSPQICDPADAAGGSSSCRSVEPNYVTDEDDHLALALALSLAEAHTDTQKGPATLATSVRAIPAHAPPIPQSETSSDTPSPFSTRLPPSIIPHPLDAVSSFGQAPRPPSPREELISKIDDILRNPPTYIPFAYEEDVKEDSLNLTHALPSISEPVVAAANPNPSSESENPNANTDLDPNPTTSMEIENPDPHTSSDVEEPHPTTSTDVENPNPNPTFELDLDPAPIASSELENHIPNPNPNVELDPNPSANPNPNTDMKADDNLDHDADRNPEDNPTTNPNPHSNLGPDPSSVQTNTNANTRGANLFDD